MRSTKKIYALCVSILLAVVMIFTSAGLGINGIYGYQKVLANEVTEYDIANNTSNIDGGLKGFKQKTEIVDDIQKTDEGIEKQTVPSLYSTESQWTNYSSDYYYNMLSSEEKLLYDRLEAAAVKYMESSEDITNVKFGNEYYIDNVDCSDLNISKERVQFVVELFYQTEAQYFYLENVWTISKTSDGNVVAASIAVYNEFVNGNTRMRYVEAFKNSIDDWVVKANKESDTYGKQKVIHDLICENITYKTGDYDQSAASGLLDYGVFNQKTVCAGYAKTFQILCNAMGIDTIMTVSSSHAWNIVNIDGYWYIVDCTYDKNYYNFNKSPYLDISSATLKNVSDNDKAHIVREDWAVYQPVCLYDYGKENNDIVWNIGKNVTATLNGAGVLTVEGTGATYDYTRGKSPIYDNDYKYGIKSVVIKSGVTGIGDYVFQDGYFEIIEIPDTLTTWSLKAFTNCTNISKIINNSNLSCDFSIFGNNDDAYMWINTATGAFVTTLTPNTTVVRTEYIPVKSISLNMEDAQMDLGNTLQLVATILPNNASQKIVKWTSSDTSVADVDNNGLVMAYTEGTTQITAQCSGFTAVCNITVNVPYEALYELKLADDGNWYMFVDGGIDYDYNGMGLNEYGWWKITNGTVDFNYNGMAQNRYGWWMITGGALDLSYNGIAQNQYGWWKITNGTVDFTANGLQYDLSTDTWWYFNNGAIDFGYTGMAENEYGWWKITNGTVDFAYNGMAENQYGWWKLLNGTVDFGYNGMAENQYGWWKITNGTVDFGYNQLALNEYGWWKITNGAVDFSYNGLAENEYGLWKVTNGAVDLSFNGPVAYMGIVYNIVNGHAV